MRPAVTIEGLPEARAMLSPYSEANLTASLKAATKAAAKVFVRPLKAEARPVSRRMATAVKVLANKRDKPGYHVAFRGKPAYFKHMVIGGTRPHGPKRAEALVFVPGWNQYMGRAPRAGRVGGGWVRARSVRGVPSNEMVARVFRAHEQQAADVAMREITRENP